MVNAGFSSLFWFFYHRGTQILSFGCIRFLTLVSLCPGILGAIIFVMKVRNAKIGDVEVIYALINSHAELEKMLFRSKADIYANLQSFLVAEVDGEVLGCCALQIIWSDLAEIKSLAVDEANIGTGVGKSLVTAALERAGELDLPRVFALTLDVGFFEKLGFEVIEKESLPMKVWSDCAKCPKADCCDEIAVVKSVLRIA